MFSREMVFGFKIGMENLILLMSGQNPENTTTAVVHHNYLEVFRNVFIPQRVAVVQETDVAGNQNGRPSTSDCRAQSRRSRTIDAAGSSVTENLDGRTCRKQL